MPTAKYTALANVTLSSTAATVTFGSIPATYRDLRLVASMKHTTSSRYTGLFLNGDSGAGTAYSAVQMFGNGSSAQAASYTNGGSFVILNNFYESTSEATLATLDFLDYRVTDKHKPIIWRSGLAGTAVNASAGRYATTSAITSIILSATPGGSNAFAVGSTFTLYGVM